MILTSLQLKTFLNPNLPRVQAVFFSLSLFQPLQGGDYDW